MTLKTYLSEDIKPLGIIAAIEDKVIINFLFGLKL